MRTILGHLAQFSSFASQGELLCTQGLAYLLADSEVSLAMGELLEDRAGVRIGEVTWHAELRQEDGRRPDLEARTIDGVSVVKIEAKLGAPFAEGQLHSYVEHMHGQSETCVLVVLVPRGRVAHTNETVLGLFELEGAGPWRSGRWPSAVIVTMSWEELCVALKERVASSEALEDLRQLEGLVRALSSSYFAPLASTEDLLAWRDRESEFVQLVDRLTRELSLDGRVMPLRHEPLDAAQSDIELFGHRLRYVGRRLGELQPNFSVGVRDPFAGHLTPLWLRFHRLTPGFSVIRARLSKSPFDADIVGDGGHVWLPLVGPWEFGGDPLYDALLAHVNDILAVALGE